MPKITVNEITKLLREKFLPDLVPSELLYGRMLKDMTPEQRAEWDRVAEENRRKYEATMRTLTPVELIRESGLASDEYDDHSAELIDVLEKYGWKIVRDDGAETS